MAGEPIQFVTGEPIPSGFEQYENLRKAELDVIRFRRKYARRNPVEKEDAPGSDEVKDDLIGLALSGGGIRSAVFNLGFLQALSHRGFLRYVDYMCSVSGGGYVAGHLAALANSVPTEKNFHEITVEQHEGSRDSLDLNQVTPDRTIG
jgi:predicted acylesterase/phospholipase RssA